MIINIKLDKHGTYGIYKDNKLIAEETSLDKAKGAKEFYERYYAGGLTDNQAHKRFDMKTKKSHSGLGLFG